MNTRELDYLLADADLGHFGKAAESCHVSQPTLSTQIKTFEERLGGQFFDRRAREIHIGVSPNTINSILPFAA